MLRSSVLERLNGKNKLEILVNTAILSVAVITIVVFAQSYLAFKEDKDAPQNLVGTKPQLSGVNWSEHKQTLLLVLQKDCRFCTESAPFYWRLWQEVAASKEARIIAVLPQTVAEGQEYLRSLNVPISDVRQTTPSSLGVRGTPTILLVNQAGVVTDAWRGKLPAEKELDVLVKLRQCRVFAECS